MSIVSRPDGTIEVRRQDNRNERKTWSLPEAERIVGTDSNTEQERRMEALAHDALGAARRTMEVRMRVLDRTGRRLAINVRPIGAVHPFDATWWISPDQSTPVPERARRR